MVTLHRFLPAVADAAPGRPSSKNSAARRRVGVWDLEVNAGFLPDVLERLNAIQDVFAFEMVDVAVPRAVSTGGESTLAWARERIDSRRVARSAKDLRRNVVASRLKIIGAQVRLTFGFDLVVVLTPDMIAFEDGGETFWNFFSWADDSVVIVSAADVRDFARQADRPFEVGLSAMMLAQVLEELLHPAVDFHKENRGCLFDFNEERATLVHTFRALRIEPSCLESIPEPYRTAAESMVGALRDSA
ncbi:hypothetical protein [Muricoccus pecuniae]|uniref:Uncharacterized protein n=1 Tax=Muricoccus pecuniae TaxID=693023 RepID=A0A840Y5T9_9PROT|nr:hypothetical protein [Roseomonas pecuniae]MBB5696518.1 hypothetical protein [Roseomonas pecuniae]